MATSTLGSGTLVLAGTTSGTTTVTATAVAGTTTLTLPAATDTLVGKATTDTLTNKTLTTPSVSSPTISDGTANGVAYLNGSKVLTTGSALVFDGTNLGIGTSSPTFSNGKGIAILDGTTSRLKLATTASGSGATDGFELSCNGSEAYIYNYENSFMAFGTNATERARFNSTGALVFAGGTTTADGIGITFPATQSASSNANTLDDYEEGTWTATITNVVGTYTLTTVNYAQYTKIGQMVYGFLSVTVTTSGTASDSMNFTLPFVPAREGSGTGRENVSSGDILISRIVTGGSGEGRLYKTSGAAAGAGTGTYVVSFMFLT